MRVLEVQADDPWGGASAHVVTLTNAFPAEVEVVVASPAGGHLRHLKAKQINWPGEDSILTIVNNVKPDLIHLHGVKAGRIGRIALWRHPVPIIYTEHLWTADFHLSNPLHEWLQLTSQRWLDRRTVATIAPSQAVANFLVDRRITPLTKLHVILHGIPVPKHACDGLPTVIGLVGSLNRTKNHPLAFDAIAMLKDERRLGPWRLDVVGSGPLRRELESIVDCLSARKEIRFREARNVDLANFGIYLQPSQSESFGLAVAEAMAAGLPVVATKGGGLPELIGDAGVLVTPGAEALAKALGELIANPKRRAELGRRARERIKRQFAVERMVNQTLAVYRGVTHVSS